jgi:hypothetical protein
MSDRFYRNPKGQGFGGGLPCQAPSEGALQSVARGALRSGYRAAEGMRETAPGYCRSTYSPLRDRIFLWKRLLSPSRSIRIVAFRASHLARPPSRQRRFIQHFPI